MTQALALYGRALAGGTLSVNFDDGSEAPLPLHRYLGPVDAADQQLLADVKGPVLDVGCGPGRHLRALNRRGVFALGVDISEQAVQLARRRGGRAVVADVFGELPGGWRTALLLDGNIGIGGHPVRLLRRLASLLDPGGVVLAEVDPPGASTAVSRARICSGEECSRWFPWACVSASNVSELAAEAGLGVTEEWTSQGRWFVTLGQRRGGDSNPRDP